MPTELEYAYAAGLFDGEGTIDIKDKVRMAVKMTDRGPVDAMKDILGGNFYQWQDTKAGRPVFEWRASGWTGTLEAIESIIEYTRAKTRQLEVVRAFDAYRERHGYSAEVRDIASGQLRGLRVVEPMPVTFDIETMGLEAPIYNVLSVTCMRGNDESSVFSLTKNVDELELLDATASALESAPFTIGWNSSRFDIPYLNTRRAIYGRRALFLGSHTDADVAYDRLFRNKKRTSLVNAANQLRVTDEYVHKTPIDWGLWNAANEGDLDAMAYVTDHAKADVILTKRIFNEVTK